MKVLSLFVVLVLGVSSGPVAASSSTPATGVAAVPLVIAHRGASGERPEHTLAAYELALAQGADFIEPDLVPTRDGVLIARHENALAIAVLDDQGRIRRSADGSPVLREATTNVAERPEFADRLTVKIVDGRPLGGWFSEDFTLAEIRTLRARERVPELRPANRLYDDRFGIPTLTEIIELLKRHEAATGQRAGIYPELKHPTYFRLEGMRLDGETIATDTGALLLAALVETGFTDPARIFVQSFEPTALMRFKARMSRRNLVLPLIQLFSDTSGRYFAPVYDLVYHAALGDPPEWQRQLAALIPGGISAGTGYAALASPEVLGFLRDRYAAGVGIPRHLAMPVTLVTTASGAARRINAGKPGALLRDARRLGLAVHVYTLRAEASMLLEAEDGRPLPVADEALELFRLDATGIFIDQPAEGRLAVQRLLVQRRLAQQGP